MAVHAYDLILTIFDFIILACLSVECLYCIIVGLLVIVLHKHAFNALWLCRLLLVLFVFIWMGGIFCGAIEYIWKHAGIDKTMCRIYAGLVFGSGQVGSTCLVLFILIQQMMPSKKMENKDTAVSTIPTSSSTIPSFPSLYPSLNILWKSGLVISIVFLVQLTLLLVDVFLKSTKVPSFLFANYHEEKGTRTNRCHQPLIAFAVYVVYMVSFLIVYTLVLRCIEVVATIVPWNNTDHLFRLLAVLFDIVTSVLIITFFVLLPIIDILRISKWETVLRSTSNDSFKTLEEHPSPTSPPSLSQVKQELNKSSDHLLPAHLKLTSSSIEFTDIFHEAPEGT